MTHAAADTAAELPPQLLEAYQYINVKETSPNSSPVIDRFLASVDLDPGLNYCAAFVSYILDKTDATHPLIRSGVALHFKTNRSIEAREVVRTEQELPPGMIAIWQRGDTWQGHTGFTSEWAGTCGTTIEANTSPPGGNQRNGNGVYEKERCIDALAYFRITHFTPVSYV